MDRFQELKNKGYGFQCLIPEASQDKEKFWFIIKQKNQLLSFLKDLTLTFHYVFLSCHIRV